jgi:hypothetical protein
MDRNKNAYKYRKVTLEGKTRLLMDRWGKNV